VKLTIRDLKKIIMEEYEQVLTEEDPDQIHKVMKPVQDFLSDAIEMALMRVMTQTDPDWSLEARHTLVKQYIGLLPFATKENLEKLERYHSLMRDKKDWSKWGVRPGGYVGPKEEDEHWAAKKSGLYGTPFYDHARDPKNMPYSGSWFMQYAIDKGYGPKDYKRIRKYYIEQLTPKQKADFIMGLDIVEKNKDDEHEWDKKCLEPERGRQKMPADRAALLRSIGVEPCPTTKEQENNNE
tara:strand:- start:93 stop:809 length:717 start_codon:yes stop_codon:yes gene_type:complete